MSADKLDLDIKSLGVEQSSIVFMVRYLDDCPGEQTMVQLKDNLCNICLQETEATVNILNFGIDSGAFVSPNGVTPGSLGSK